MGSCCSWPRRRASAVRGVSCWGCGRGRLWIEGVGAI